MTLTNYLITLRFISFQKSTANPSLSPDAETSQFSVFFWWVLGIALLTAALFISARMGIYQEVLYKRYGKYPREALYVTVSEPQPIHPPISTFTTTVYPPTIPLSIYDKIKPPVSPSHYLSPARPPHPFHPYHFSNYNPFNYFLFFLALQTAPVTAARLLIAVQQHLGAHQDCIGHRTLNHCARHRFANCLGLAHRQLSDTIPVHRLRIRIDHRMFIANGYASRYFT